MKKFFKRMIATVGAFLLAFISCIGMFQGRILYAYAATENAFDKTSVNEDLSETDWLKYPANPLGTPSVVNFVEYCYTDNVAENENYALYLYVYNPAKLSFSLKGNSVNMAIGYDGTEPNKYADVDLITCGASTGDKAGLIYKFRIDIPERVYTNARLFQQDYKYRQYDIVGVQLRQVGVETHDWDVGRKYKVTGYAKGMDDTSQEEATLAVEYSGLETLNLDVHPTYYRPEGNNGKNEYTQDSLHSVYFAVPKDKGNITAMSAEWLDAVLKPMLCTGNKEAYTAIEPYLGKQASWNTDELDHYSSELKYGYMGNLSYNVSDVNVAYADWAFNFLCGVDDGYIDIYEPPGYGSPLTIGCHLSLDPNGYNIDNIPFLYLMFAPDIWGNDSADSYNVPSELIKKKMEQSYAKFGGEKIEGVEGDYSSLIFESVNAEKTKMDFTLDSTFEQKGYVIDKSWWEKLWGTSHIEECTKFNGVKAIYAVQDSDITGSMAVDCDNLYLSTGDYDDFCKFYEANKKDHTVYFLRYQVSDYVSQEATLLEEHDNLDGTPGWRLIDTNAFFFQETVNLGFDVIQVAMEKDGVETVYGVVSDPLDIVHDGTHPLQTTSDFDWWGVLFGFLLMALFIGFLLVIAPSLVVAILKGVWWLICLPFRLLGLLWDKLTGK